MKAVIQRVSRASVTVDGKVVGAIKQGLVVLLGVEVDDTDEDAKFLANKIVNLRIFPDDKHRMNRSLLDINGELLVISQFTLLGDCRKGRRPSFHLAAPPEKAVPLYEKFIEYCKSFGVNVQTGVFQAMMTVEIINEGPVTFWLDSRISRRGNIKSSASTN